MEVPKAGHQHKLHCSYAELVLSLKSRFYNLCPEFYWGRSCSVGRKLSSGPNGSVSRFTCEPPPCTLIVPGACKIRRACTFLQAPIQIMHLRISKKGELAPPWRIKIVMACDRTILRDVSQTVGNSPLRFPL